MKPAKTFEAWMREVDRACWAKAGVSVHDLPDMPFADWYKDGMRPASAAAKAIRVYKSEF